MIWHAINKNFYHPTQAIWKKHWYLEIITGTRPQGKTSTIQTFWQERSSCFLIIKYPGWVISSPWLKPSALSYKTLNEIPLYLLRRPQSHTGINLLPTDQPLSHVLSNLILRLIASLSSIWLDQEAELWEKRQSNLPSNTFKIKNVERS